MTKLDLIAMELIKVTLMKQHSINGNKRKLMWTWSYAVSANGC